MKPLLRVPAVITVLALGGCPDAGLTTPSTFASPLCAAPAPLYGEKDPAAPRFIVVYHDEVDAVTTTDELAGKYGFRPVHVYTHALQGFAAEFPASTLAALRCEPAVDFIEHDSVFQLGA